MRRAKPQTVRNESKMNDDRISQERFRLSPIYKEEEKNSEPTIAAFLCSKNSSSWLLFNQCYWEEKKQAALMSSKAQMDIFIFFRATAAATAAWLVLEAEKPFVGYGTHLSCLHGLWLLITNNGAIYITHTATAIY